MQMASPLSVPTEHIYSWFMSVYTHIYSKSVCLHAQWLMIVLIVYFVTPVPSIYESESAGEGFQGLQRDEPQDSACTMSWPQHSACLTLPMSKNSTNLLRPLWSLLRKKGKYCAELNSKDPEFLYRGWKCIFLSPPIKGLDLDWSLGIKDTF